VVPGVRRKNGEIYLECHRILALANQGEDRLSNVSAICAGTTIGVKRREIATEMIAKVKAAEARRLKAIA
jgi:hypothetical protein